VEGMQKARPGSEVKISGASVVSQAPTKKEGS